MTTPRVLHVVQSGGGGGVQRHVRDLATGLAPHTAGVVVGSDGWLCDRLRAAGIPIIAAPTLRRALDPLAVRAAGAEVRRAAATTGATVVHAHGIFALLAARAAFPLPLVYTAHGFQWRDPEHPRWLRRLSRLLHRRLAPHLAALIAVSAEEARDAGGLGLPPARIHHIANGVALPPAGVAPPPQPVLGTAGRLVAGKNVEGLLRLLTLLPPDVTLWIAGDGPAAPTLRAKAEAIGIGGRVRWLGWCEDLTSFYRGIGVFCTLSRKEGLPYAVLDAMAYGLPVVASDIAAHAELLGGDWGGLVREGNLAEAVERVRRWLDEPLAWQTASLAARAAVGERFGLQGMLERTLAVHRAVCPQAARADVAPSNR